MGKDWVREAELWNLETLSGGKICLRGLSNGYISAKPDGTISCDKEEVGDWEMFEWLTEYTNPEKEKTVKGSIFSQRKQRSDSMSSSSSSMSSASGSVAAQGKHIFRSRYSLHIHFIYTSYTLHIPH